MRALTSFQCVLGSNAGIDALGGFVAGSLLCWERSFPGTPVFPSPQKLTFPNSNSARNGRQRTTLWICYLDVVIFDVIYLLFYLFIREIDH